MPSKPPPGSRPDSIVIKYVYEKAGKRYEWAANELPADFNTYKYVDRIDKVVRKGNADPAIKGFTLVGVSGEDSTQIVLEQPAAVVAFALDFTNHQWIKAFSDVVKTAQSRNIPVYVASTNLLDGEKAFSEEGITGVQFFNTDFTVVRTVARTTPTLLFLKKGTIVQKFSKNGMADAKTAVASL